MRLWSISPEYLDTKGLVGLWREALLAKKVIAGNTRGYKNHPQLLRFKNSSVPLKHINTYLFYIYIEAKKRGYFFDKTKCKYYPLKKIKVTSGQIKYEFFHLLKKLKKRNALLYKKLYNIKNIKPNKLFKIVKGNIETWERQEDE
jgi:hypothetical protein